MGIAIRRTRGSVAACIRRLLIISALAAIALSPARGQSSVPPLPALPVTFVFSMRRRRDVSSHNYRLASRFHGTSTCWPQARLFSRPPLPIATCLGILQHDRRVLRRRHWRPRPDGFWTPRGRYRSMWNLGPGCSGCHIFPPESSNANGLGVGTGAQRDWHGQPAFTVQATLCPTGPIVPQPLSA
jgi:hypothetical protein